MLKLAIIGCGRTGHKIAKSVIRDEELSKNYFVSVFDFDIVEEKNMNTQDFSKHFLGVGKTEAFKEENKEYSTMFETYNIKIEEKTLYYLKKHDIILNATDNFDLSYILNKFCVKNNKILIHTAVSKFSVFISCTNKKPCLECFLHKKRFYYSEPKTESIFLCTSIALSFLRDIYKNKRKVIGFSFFGDTDKKIFNFLKITPLRGCYVCSHF